MKSLAHQDFSAKREISERNYKLFKDYLIMAYENKHKCAVYINPPELDFALIAPIEVSVIGFSNFGDIELCLEKLPKHVIDSHKDTYKEFVEFLNEKG